MNFQSSFQLNVGELSGIYFTLLKEEDFDFKTKNISVDIEKKDTIIEILIKANSLLEIKIGTTAIIKSLEIIEKVIKNG